MIMMRVAKKNKDFMWVEHNKKETICCDFNNRNENWAKNRSENCVT